MAVYRKGRAYRAVCLDLGLMVERPTWEAATEELDRVIRGYFEDAQQASIAPEDILRPVPEAERRYVYRQLAFAAAGQFIASLFRTGRRGDGGRPKVTFTHNYCAM